MQLLKITIIGNSVALRVRPVCDFPNNKNYGCILSDTLKRMFPTTLPIVTNMGRHRKLISEGVNELESYISTYPNYFVVNFGIVDACSRECPLWYSNIINSKSNSIRVNIFKIIYSLILQKNRSLFTKFRGQKPWTSHKKFREHYQQIINYLLKETNSKIILLEINRPNDRIESELPGSQRRVKQYNSIIEELSLKNDCTLIKTDDLTSEIDYPDGIHFSLVGNKKIASRISEAIQSLEASKKEKLK